MSFLLDTHAFLWFVNDHSQHLGDWKFENTSNYAGMIRWMRQSPGPITKPIW